ncbi:MAG: hypothetical protein ACREQA_24765, partial [Candidatus Binatia bacterium]
ATTPLFSALFAILFLDERMTWPIFFATLLIIIGITVLSHGSTRLTTGRGGSMQRIRFLYVLYPLLASLLAGFSQILRKFGLGAVPHPFLAAAVTATSSLGISLLTVWAAGRRKQILVLNKECLYFYLAAGIAVSLGMVSIYYALDRGQVTVGPGIRGRESFHDSQHDLGALSTCLCGHADRSPSGHKGRCH